VRDRGIKTDLPVSLFTDHRFALVELFNIPYYQNVVARRMYPNRYLKYPFGYNYSINYAKHFLFNQNTSAKI
jgi:hypothetical protein